MSVNKDAVTALPNDIVVKSRGFYTAYEGTSAGDNLAIGGTAALYLQGGAGADTLVASSNYDVLIGGAGVDKLSSRIGRDSFVFSRLSDSYGNVQGSHSDLITDWSATDRLDLTGIGLDFADLTVSYDAARDLTFVRATEANSAGNYFEVRLQGKLAQPLTKDNFVLRVDGTSGDDRLELRPEERSVVINGGAGNDRLTDGVGQDSTSTFHGGAGGDTLLTVARWDDGAQNTFLYTVISDSFVNDKTGAAAVDQIWSVLSGRDVIDVSALGFTALGDGYNGTLKFSYDRVHDYYVAQSLETDAQGNRFVLNFHLDDWFRDGVPDTEVDKGLFYFAGNTSTANEYNTVTGSDTAGEELRANREGAILTGNDGGDNLIAGAGADTLVYLSRHDSIQGEPVSSDQLERISAEEDTIFGFDVSQDKLDVSAVGFTGLGSGSNGTLKLIYDPAQDQTLLRNDELQRDGSRFELALQGSLATSLSNANLITAAANPPISAQAGPRGQAYWEGTAAANVITADNKASNYLYGDAGNDVLRGGTGRDVLEGGTGVDTLTGGGSSGDTYVFKSLYDSYGLDGISHSDLITDWNAASRLDLTALGLQRVGDGYNGDVAVSYDAGENLTYVRSLDNYPSSYYFEVRIHGDARDSLGTRNFVLMQKGTYLEDTFDQRTSEAQYVLDGGYGNDQLYGSQAAGNVFIGGLGADQLHGISGADTYRYNSVRDSFVNARDNVSAVDLISHFAYGQGDLIDVSALGFTGLGDGYHNTLHYGYDASTGHVLVQSFDGGLYGDRFVLELDYARALKAGSGSDADQFIFARGPGTGTAYNTLTGSQAYDVLHNPGENTIFVGGGGADALIGSSAKDSFRFETASDSYRGQADLISDFELSKDKLDVAALGYTRLGDGTDGTLKVIYNENLDRTYVRSLETDGEGHRFEVALEGDLTGLAHRNFVFASSTPQATAASDIGGAGAEAVEVALVGVAPVSEHPLTG